MSKMDRCPFLQTDCFAYGIYGRCIGLSDTKFKQDVCPFYKTRLERQKGHYEAVKRLEEMGRYDLIGKYGESADQPRIWGDIDA